MTPIRIYSPEGNVGSAGNHRRKNRNPSTPYTNSTTPDNPAPTQNTGGLTLISP